MPATPEQPDNDNFSDAAEVSITADELAAAAGDLDKIRSSVVTPGSYDSESITVLEGLDAVRKRPGMYIGSTGERGLHHLVYEVVDNAVDEALAGYCDTILVRILPEGGIQVVDNGRGIPVKEHPKEKIPAVTLALTVLHAGGKFGDGGYKVSGGLHGVGVSVVNALSATLTVDVKRDGYRWSQDFVLGDPVTPLEQHEATDETGTTVTFFPSPDIFETTVFSYNTLVTRFREYAFLNKGLTISIRDERPDRLRRERRGDHRHVPLRRRADRLRPLPHRQQGGGAHLGDRDGGRAARQRHQRRGGDAVEHVLPGVGAHLRQHHQHPRGRHPRGGLPGRADQHRQQVGRELGG